MSLWKIPTLPSYDKSMFQETIHCLIWKVLNKYPKIFFKTNPKYQREHKNKKVRWSWTVWSSPPLQRLISVSSQVTVFFSVLFFSFSFSHLFFHCSAVSSTFRHTVFLTVFALVRQEGERICSEYHPAQPLTGRFHRRATWPFFLLSRKVTMLMELPREVFSIAPSSSRPVLSCYI